MPAHLMATEIIPLIMPAIMLAFLLEKTMEFALPEHIKFSQSLPGPVAFNLSDSCAQGVTLSELLAFRGEQPFDSSLGYNPVAGSDPLKSAIQQYHLRSTDTVADQQVVSFTGAQEAIYAAMANLLQPNDEVIVFTPCYPSLLNLPKRLGAKVHGIALSAENNWQFDIQQVAKLANARTKMIVINAPHNPTGATLNREQLEHLLCIAEQCDAYLLSDEVSAQNANDACIHNGQFVTYTKSITLGVLSKSLGLPGIRVGWAICGSTELAQQLLSCKTYLSICGSAVDDMLAVTALEHSDVILRRNSDIIATNVQLMQQFVSRNQDKVDWVAPAAGMLSLLQVKGVSDGKAWARRFAQELQTLLLPASLFALTHQQYFRLGLGKENFASGLERLQIFLQD
ncbi:aminotransferase class I/II-fold pyridoxal phosphate-dependent enzyme [Pseudoalteromonas 'SMAR']|uniref:aminotransferase class I/II-fold pyridoxal phosphate-dependent enzyme n=1 Tax=Pseudoalteromonas 'SMAR' TaxID=3416908 RepID=UPI003AF3073F